MVLEPVKCPVCGGTNVIKHGKSGEGKQRYLCQDPECQVAPHLTVVSDVMSDVTPKARRIFNTLQAQHPQ